MENSINEYLHQYAAARNTKASATVDELTLMIPRCRTDKVSLSFLPAAAVRL